MYQYKGCGLDNVFLANGYERRRTHSGMEVLHIEDIEGLHRTIALSLTVNPAAIGAQQFRFLRKELGMSQKLVGGAMGVSEQAVSLWERGTQPIPQYALVMICVMAREYITGQPSMKSAIDRACAADRALARTELHIERTDQGAWAQMAA